MKKQVRFVDEADAYRFVLDGDEGVSFSLSKDTLSFSANDFYTCFFKSIDEKPEYELVGPESELKGQPKHAFDTVAAIFKKVCDSIDESWFKKRDGTDTQPLPDLDENEY